jgi:hypothetical protein
LLIKVMPAKSRSQVYFFVELALIICTGESVMAGNEKAPG